MSSGTAHDAYRLRVLTARDLERVLDPDALVDAVAGGMTAIAERRVSMPPRLTVSAPKAKGSLLVMAGHLHGGATITAKLSSRLRSRSPAAAHQREALVVVFDANLGLPVAIMDGNQLTAMRTAAASRLATRLLANDDADTVAILGSGVVAEAHAAAMLRERPSIRELRLVDRNGAVARVLARRLLESTGANVVVCHSYEDALAGAGIVCAATASPTPVVRREWLSDGAHVNSVGFAPAGREIAAEVVRDSLVVVEERETALAPEPVGSNDLTFPVRDGVVPPTHIRLELGEVARDRSCGRVSPAQLTLYKSVGVAAQDDAAAALALEVARREGVGTVVEI